MNGKENGESGKYRFDIKTLGHDVEISAEPLDPDSSLPYFLIDREGVLLVEEDGPATAQSKPYQD